jgi:hypothetical protein
MRTLQITPLPQTQNCEAIAIVRNKLIACNEIPFKHPYPKLKIAKQLQSFGTSSLPAIRKLD